MLDYKQMLEDVLDCQDYDNRSYELALQGIEEREQSGAVKYIGQAIENLGLRLQGKDPLEERANRRVLENRVKMIGERRPPPNYNKMMAELKSCLKG